MPLLTQAMIVRTRFAPSPTGTLHMGGARTALYNYCLAKALGGQYILRIEDTDAARSTQEAKQALIQDLKWLGLNWDEAPYHQSERYAIYQDLAQQLVSKGKAFYCFASDQDIAKARESAKYPAAFQFQSPDRDLTLAQAQARLQAGEPAVIRFRNEFKDQSFEVHDLVRGKVVLSGDMVGDFVILRADGSPVYNFCCAVDDGLMRITHVLRGEEHLPNTLRQLMIYQALSLPIPQFGHLSLILGSDHKKLSKRTGARSVGDFRQEGFLAPAVINYLALLGWSDPKSRDLLSLDDLISVFTVDRLNPAGPMYDEARLRWMNQQYIRQLQPTALWQAIVPYLNQAAYQLPQDPAWQTKSVARLMQDWHQLTDCIPVYAYFDQYTPPALDTQATSLIQTKEVRQVMLAWQSQLDTIDTDPNQPLDPITYKSFIKHIQNHCGVKGKQLFMPIRIAMIGCPQGLDLMSTVELCSLDLLRKRAAHYLSLPGLTIAD
ncbi:MAG: glutamate--tRNA ligase [Pseudomonadota bacterium]|nr:glutamate--tRNA ligase [Pseudomonadota bacterium]